MIALIVHGFIVGFICFLLGVVYQRCRRNAKECTPSTSNNTARDAIALLARVSWFMEGCLCDSARKGAAHDLRVEVSDFMAAQRHP